LPSFSVLLSVHAAEQPTVTWPEQVAVSGIVVRGGGVAGWAAARPAASEQIRNSAAFRIGLSGVGRRTTPEPDRFGLGRGFVTRLGLPDGAMSTFSP